MAIKTRIIEEKDRPDAYPCLKETTTGLIVLFNAPGTGMVVGFTNEKAALRMGEYSTDWEEKEFKRLYGTIEIGNG